MKKFLTFSVSFLSALILFVTMAGICFGLSSGFGWSDGFGLYPRSASSFAEETPSDEPPERHADVLAVYENGDALYIARVDICLSGGSAAVPVSSGILYGEKTLKNILKDDGLYPFLSACRATAGEMKFIKFNSETFVKIADRTKGLIYNDKSGRALLLTGVQADAVLDSGTFADFCRQIADNAVKNGILREFDFAVNLCENDFSYPCLYRLTHG